MGKAQTLQSQNSGEEAKGANSTESAKIHHQATFSWLKQYKWWLEMSIYTLFVVCGSAVATLLGRLYYDKGGKSKWMATFVQNAGFPVMLPFFFISRTKFSDAESDTDTKPSVLVLAAVYLFLGLFLAADCMLYSIGLMYLPVSTYSMICASQLGFNAVFSFFLNAQKFTPYIINSLVLLTISAILLVFQTDDSKDSSGASRKKYLLGFVCTLAGSAGYALMLSITELVFQRIIKKETFREIVNMSFYQCLVASVATLIGLFASGDWKSLNAEMEGFQLGKVSYIMNLVWTAFSWQAFTLGYVGLIFKVSSLFSNVISVFSTPVAPVLAVVIFHDRMTAIKVVAMVLAMWGFTSYVYQHYLDDLKAKKCAADVSEVSLAERG